MRVCALRAVRVCGCALDVCHINNNASYMCVCDRIWWLGGVQRSTHAFRMCAHLRASALLLVDPRAYTNTKTRTHTHSHPSPCVSHAASKYAQKRVPPATTGHPNRRRTCAASAYPIPVHIAPFYRLYLAARCVFVLVCARVHWHSSLVCAHFRVATS